MEIRAVAMKLPNLELLPFAEVDSRGVILNLSTQAVCTRNGESTL